MSLLAPYILHGSGGGGGSPTATYVTPQTANINAATSVNVGGFSLTEGDYLVFVQYCEDTGPVPNSCTVPSGTSSTVKAGAIGATNQTLAAFRVGVPAGGATTFTIGFSASAPFAPVIVQPVKIANGTTFTAGTQTANGSTTAAANINSDVATSAGDLVVMYGACNNGGATWTAGTGLDAMLGQTAIGGDAVGIASQDAASGGSPETFGMIQDINFSQATVLAVGVS